MCRAGRRPRSPGPCRNALSAARSDPVEQLRRVLQPQPEPATKRADSPRHAHRNAHRSPPPTTGSADNPSASNTPRRASPAQRQLVWKRGLPPPPAPDPRLTSAANGGIVGRAGVGGERAVARFECACRGESARWWRARAVAGVLDGAVRPGSDRAADSAFGTVLETAVADPARHISELPVLPGDEFERVTQGFNESFEALRCRGTARCTRWSRRRLLRRRIGVAVWCAGTECLYRELDERANAVARHLHKAGPGRVRWSACGCADPWRWWSHCWGAQGRARICRWIRICPPPGWTSRSPTRGRRGAHRRRMSRPRHRAAAGAARCEVPPREPGLCDLHLGSTGTSEGCGGRAWRLLNRLAWMQAAYELEQSDVVCRRRRSPSTFGCGSSSGR